MPIWGMVLLSAVVALFASATALAVVFFSLALLTYYFPSEKEIIRRKAADLLQARSDLSEEERTFLNDLRWRSPANRFFLAVPKIFGVVFVAVFAVCFYFH
jgi:hypothetical protein